MIEKLTEEKIKEINKKHLERWKSLSPAQKRKEKRQQKEAKKLLNHCEESTEWGTRLNPTKFDLSKFLFLKDLRQDYIPNSYLLKDLAFIARKVLILRYLLIEAGLRNYQVKEILDEVNFYRISNNPKKFYNDRDSYVQDGDRLSEIELNLQLSKYGLSKPADISRKVIEGKIEKILNEKTEEFINKFSNSFSKEIGALLSDRKNVLSADEYFKSIKLSLSYFFDDIIENQFNVQNPKYYSSYFISYLNEMYWLNEKGLEKMLNIYLYLPTFLLSLAKSEKQVATLVSDYTNKIDKELKDNKKYMTDLEQLITDIKNKNRTYDISLFRKAKEIYENQRGKRPRITQAEALIIANNELLIYENELLRDRNGFDTDFFSDMQNSFRKQHKEL